MERDAGIVECPHDGVEALEAQQALLGCSLNYESHLLSGRWWSPRLAAD